MGVEAHADRVVDRFPFWNEGGEAAESAEGKSPGDRVVGVNDGEDLTNEFINVEDLLEVGFTLLANSKDPETKEVGAGAEHIGEFEKCGVDQDWEGIPLEERGETDDGLALVTDFS